MVLLMASEAVASDNDERERTLLFNTRGLAVSGAVATGIFFAAAAKLKLAFLESTIEEKKVKSGVLLELICSRAQSKLLINWFRARRMTLRILPGESRDREGAVRNGVAVFYDNDTYRALAGDSVEKYSRCVSDPTASAATRLGEMILRVAVERKKGRKAMNIVGWHGQHDEAGFEKQLREIESGRRLQPSWQPRL